MTLPLTGIRVLDLTSVIMGPLATQILADLGAEVITVEEPVGTLSRVMTAGPHPQLSGIALNLLRNKRNIVLNLKMPESRQALLELLAASDVFVTNLRPSAIARLHLSYDEVSAVAPQLVYCQAQGWPLDSERANEPAYDDIIQAASGLPDAALRASGQAQFAPTILADKVCGLTIAYAVLAALVGRGSTGSGCHLEVPMTEVMKSFVLVEHGGPAIPEPPLGAAGYPRILVPTRRPQRTLDGWASVLPYSRDNYHDLFREGGREDLIGDERVRSARNRVRYAGELYEIVGEIVATRTTAHWAEFCARGSIPMSPVTSLDDMVGALPLAQHPVAGAYRVIPQPVRITAAGDQDHEYSGAGDPAGRADAVVRRPAALPGEHTAEVLAELGLSAEQIDRISAEAQEPTRQRYAARPKEPVR